jgi:hypothetical protein
MAMEPGSRGGICLFELPFAEFAFPSAFFLFFGDRPFTLLFYSTLSCSDSVSRFCPVFPMVLGGKRRLCYCSSMYLNRGCTLVCFVLSIWIWIWPFAFSPLLDSLGLGVALVASGLVWMVWLIRSGILSIVLSCLVLLVLLSFSGSAI